MQKIAVIGCPCSGKSTLSKLIGNYLNIPVYHLDKIFWVEKGGIKQEEFISKQREIMTNDRWIIDGGFPKSKSFDLRLMNADTIIYFDFPLCVIYWRMFKRFIQYRNTVRPDMAPGKKEKLNWDLISYVWNYSKKEERVTINNYISLKDVFIVKNLKDEKEFLKVIINKTLT
jgi:adenylate kinase family enzyme